ncbi:S-formylglutathione hydrolase [Vibrio sp. SM6]|uniref:S-formylglutathione hydrolase n=1 Tax=Vibrio agarilyticus TaxID=2726741 RepID=A0A7X8YFT4_9VIBR|nr:S-formylglutathione hydrolase [Vibrio agarilyticus]NLS11890.1 S-formylglutathione hydrolase [Vibrio agarilyticus]
MSHHKHHDPTTAQNNADSVDWGLIKLSENRAFNGWHQRFSHRSQCNRSEMCFSVFLPPKVEDNHQVPVVYWLSGLTCTDENFMQKAGAFRIAADLGLAIVVPDTSPRGESVADDPSYDLGQGAGFYVNAIQQPWAEHYQMYDYVTQELPQIIEANFPVTSRRSIAGHSMGGHGALVIGLRNAHRYRSISALSPICNPMECHWGQKAFSTYLGPLKASWFEYDASELLKQHGTALPILIDQGEQDEFLNDQLRPNTLLDALPVENDRLTLTLHPFYDHSYYFVASFIEQHLRFHARFLL